MTVDVNFPTPSEPAFPWHPRDATDPPDSSRRGVDRSFAVWVVVMTSSRWRRRLIVIGDGYFSISTAVIGAERAQCGRPDGLLGLDPGQMDGWKEDEFGSASPASPAAQRNTILGNQTGRKLSTCR